MVYRYLGQCDDLRSRGFERFWQDMMEAKKPLGWGVLDFVEKCDRSSLMSFLDIEDPVLLTDLEDALIEYTADDPDSGYYSSTWGEFDCIFIHTAGFEFIFIDIEPYGTKPITDIYSAVRALGIPHDHHSSDLYIPVDYKTECLVNAYKWKCNVTRFLSETDFKPDGSKQTWFDIPFGYHESNRRA